MTGGVGRSKHMRRWNWRTPSGRIVPMVTPVRTYGGQLVDDGRQYPVESSATKVRPWQQRAKNRRRNKAARISRRRNRG